MNDFLAPDPLAALIDRAIEQGWHLVPQVAHGGLDNGLWRCVDGRTDVVTLPDLGPSVVVRFHGGPQAGQPRRTGHPRWRHLVPVELALDWLLSDPADDTRLTEWNTAQQPSTTLTNPDAPVIASRQDVRNRAAEWFLNASATESGEFIRQTLTWGQHHHRSPFGDDTS